MEIHGAAAGATAPWLALGVVLGALIVLVSGGIAALILRRRDPGTPAAGVDAAAAGNGEDDLPGFLESPPGSTAGTTAPAGWASLTAPAAPATAPALVPRGRRDTVVVLAAMAVTGLLLVAAAAAVAVASRPDSGSRHDERAAERGGAVARLTFGGVVLEPRAVGVTATYPVVEVASDGRRSRAQVELPTFNCLTAEAPDDPIAAGCTPSLTEYAELTSPELVVDREGQSLHVSGRFPTEVRPNGSAPEPTGRVYDLRITVAPADGASEKGWQPAEGSLELGSGRATTVDDPGVSVLRSDA